MESVIFITGASDGIGKATALELAKQNHSLILHGKNQNKLEAVVQEIKDSTGNKKIDSILCDLSSLEEIREVSQEIIKKFPRINILLNNAGVYMKEKVLSKDGFEMTFAVNHLAPFLLTLELLPVLKNNSPARIINVSSVAHRNGVMDLDNLNGEKGFDPYGSYALSKLANIFFTIKLSELLKDSSVAVNCLHPGVISTKLLKTGFNISGASTNEGAKTSVYLATSDEVKDTTGKYFVNCKLASTQNQYLNNSNLVNVFWKKSEEFVNK